MTSGIRSSRYFNLINNTIVNVKSDGIRFNSLLSTNNQILNNIIIHPGSLGLYSTPEMSYINTITGVSCVKAHNFKEPTMQNIAFRDTLTGNYRLKANSPAKDMGQDVSGFGITFDHDSIMRPYYSLFDIGAYEEHPENVWTGASSSSWNDVKNWSQSNIPFPDDNVVIPAGTLYLPLAANSGIACHHLTVASGAYLFTSPASELTVYGDLTIQAGGIMDNSGTIQLKGNLVNWNQ